LPNFPSGTVQVGQVRWRVYFYFPGPDPRNDGTFVTIKDTQIDEYIHAYEENWKKYISLKKQILIPGSYETPGLCNMTIRIGGHREGVRLANFFLPINNETEIKKIISDLKWARDRANSIMVSSIYSDKKASTGKRDIILTKEETIKKFATMVKSYAILKEKIEVENQNGQYLKENTELKYALSQITKQQIQQREMIDSLFNKLEEQQNYIVESESRYITLLEDFQKIKEEINFLKTKEEESPLTKSRGKLNSFQIQLDSLRKSQINLTNELKIISQNPKKTRFLTFFSRD
jgi:hypothetical protein